MSDHVPPSWPRIDTRGVRYVSTLPAKLRPFSRLGSAGTPAPIEPPTPHMPVAGTRRWAYANGALLTSNDRVTITRRLARISSNSFLFLHRRGVQLNLGQGEGLQVACRRRLIAEFLAAEFQARSENKFSPTGRSGGRQAEEPDRRRGRGAPPRTSEKQRPERTDRPGSGESRIGLFSRV